MLDAGCLMLDAGDEKKKEKSDPGTLALRSSNNLMKR